MSRPNSALQLRELLAGQVSGGMLVFIYHHMYILQQTLGVLVRGTADLGLAVAASESHGSNAENSEISRTRIACIAATELANAIASSGGKLRFSDAVTLVLLVRIGKDVSPMAFGGEGQYGSVVADLVREHAASAGNARVVALVVAAKDDPLASSQKVLPSAFADVWRRTSSWPYVAHGVYVRSLRDMQPEQLVAVLRWLPPASPLPFAIPMLALDLNPSPALLAVPSSKSATVVWSAMIAVSGVDVRSLMSSSGGSSLSAMSDALIDRSKASSNAVSPPPAKVRSLRLWRATEYVASENVGDHCIVSAHVDVWNAELGAWRLVAVLDLPAKVALRADGARVAQANLSLDVDSPHAAAGDDEEATSSRRIAAASRPTFIQRHMMITRTLPLEIPIADKPRISSQQTGDDGRPIVTAGDDLWSSPVRRAADAAIDSVLQRLPSDAPAVRELLDASRLLSELQNSGDGGRAMLEQRLRGALVAAEKSAAENARIDINFRRATMRHHELSNTDRTVRRLLPFYSAVLDLRSLRIAPHGWSLYWTSADVRTRSDNMTARPLAVLGREKVGKSWLVSKLSGNALADEKLHTMGLCIQTMHASEHNAAPPFVVFDVAGDGVAVRPELEQDQRATESFLRRVAATLSGGAVLYVCNKFDNQVQAEIDALYNEMLAQDANLTMEDLNVFVVHNVLTIGSAQALRLYKSELLRLVSLSAPTSGIFDDDDAAVPDVGLERATSSERSLASLVSDDPRANIMRINGQKHVFLVSEVGGGLSNSFTDRPWCDTFNYQAIKQLQLQLVRRLPVIQGFALRERLLAALRQHVPDYWHNHEQFRLTIESAAEVVVRRESGGTTTSVLRDVVTVLDAATKQPVSSDRLMTLHPRTRVRESIADSDVALRGASEEVARFGGKWQHVMVALPGYDESALASGGVRFEITRHNGLSRLLVIASAPLTGPMAALMCGGEFAWVCPPQYKLPEILEDQWRTLVHVRAGSTSDDGSSAFACRLTNGVLECFVKLREVEM